MSELPVRINRWRGLFTAAAILLLWISGLALFLSLNFSGLSLLSIAAIIAWQTFIATGVFITAHDAMHGAVFPGKPALNKSIGTLAITVYALFSWKNLLEKHRLHHAHPASDQDPDFHGPDHKGFGRWYLHFLLSYVSWFQFAGMAVVFNILHHLFSVPLSNLLLFWVLPVVLSTLQLFYFGTYLPHRETGTGYSDKHRTNSNTYGTILSFISCYHFGYHWEHHQYPHIPWWKLPEARRMKPAKQ